MAKTKRPRQVGKKKGAADGAKWKYILHRTKGKIIANIRKGDPTTLARIHDFLAGRVRRGADKYIG